MGYCMSQCESDFFVPADKLGAMVAAIQALHGEETIGDSSGRHFSWVPQNFHTISDPVESLRAWRWDAELDDEGNINVLYFGGEKVGDEDTLFSAIAPFVKAGSYIEMQGEEGERWRWLFDGQEMTEKSATITWD
jgi:hypothetical protein